MASTDPNSTDYYQSQYAANTATANTAPANGYQAAINQQISQLSAPTTANSAPVQAQTDAYHVTSQRNLAANRDALAQQAYAGGTLNTGGYGQQQQAAREASDAAEGTNTANVMKDAETQRLAALDSDLGLGQTGALQQQQLTNQANQYGSTLGLSYDQLAAQKAAQQAAINAQLKIASDQNALGYFGVNTNADLTTRGQDISATGSL